MASTPTPQNTLYDDMQQVNASVLDPKIRVDARDSQQIQRSYLMTYKYDAFITAKNPDNVNDAYVVDVYEKGYVASDGSDQDPTRKGITAHVLHNEDFWDVGDMCRIHLLPDGTAWIAHEDPAILAIVVCRGPNEEQDFPDNRYWMSFAYIANTDADATSTLDVREFPAASKFHRVICATNFFENNCKTHLVRPCTWGILKWGWDLHSQIPDRRWFVEVLDEGTCKCDPCSMSNSSSASKSMSVGSGSNSASCDCPPGTVRQMVLKDWNFLDLCLPGRIQKDYIEVCMPCDAKTMQLIEILPCCCTGGGPGSGSSTSTSSEGSSGSTTGGGGLTPSSSSSSSNSSGSYYLPSYSSSSSSSSSTSHGSFSSQCYTRWTVFYWQCPDGDDFPFSVAFHTTVCVGAPSVHLAWWSPNPPRISSVGGDFTPTGTYCTYQIDVPTTGVCLNGCVDAIVQPMPFLPDAVTDSCPDDCLPSTSASALASASASSMASDSPLYYAYTVRYSCQHGYLDGIASEDSIFPDGLANPHCGATGYAATFASWGLLSRNENFCTFCIIIQGGTCGTPVPPSLPAIPTVEQADSICSCSQSSSGSHTYKCYTRTRYRFYSCTSSQSNYSFNVCLRDDQVNLTWSLLYSGFSQPAFEGDLLHGPWCQYQIDVLNTNAANCTDCTDTLDRMPDPGSPDLSTCLCPSSSSGSGSASSSNGTLFYAFRVTFSCGNGFGNSPHLAATFPGGGDNPRCGDSGGYNLNSWHFYEMEEGECILVYIMTGGTCNVPNPPATPTITLAQANALCSCGSSASYASVSDSGYNCYTTITSYYYPCTNQWVDFFAAKCLRPVDAQIGWHYLYSGTNVADSEFPNIPSGPFCAYSIDVLNTNNPNCSGCSNATMMNLSNAGGHPVSTECADVNCSASNSGVSSSLQSSGGISGRQCYSLWRAFYRCDGTMEGPFFIENTCFLSISSLLNWHFVGMVGIGSPLTVKGQFEIYVANNNPCSSDFDTCNQFPASRQPDTGLIDPTPASSQCGICISQWSFTYNCVDQSTTGPTWVSNTCMSSDSSATGWGSPTESDGIYTWTGYFLTGNQCSLDGSVPCASDARGTTPTAPNTGSGSGINCQACVATTIAIWDCSLNSYAGGWSTSPSVQYYSCGGSTSAWSISGTSGTQTTFVGAFATGADCAISDDCTSYSPTTPDVSSIKCQNCVQNWTFTYNCQSTVTNLSATGSAYCAAPGSYTVGWEVSPSFDDTSAIYTWTGVFETGQPCNGNGDCTSSASTPSTPSTSGYSCYTCIAKWTYIYNCVDASTSLTYVDSSCSYTATGWDSGSQSGSTWTWTGYFTVGGYCTNQSQSGSCGGQGETPSAPDTSSIVCQRCYSTWVFSLVCNGNSTSGPTFQSSNCATPGTYTLDWESPTFDASSGTYTWTGIFEGDWCDGDTCPESDTPSVPYYASFESCAPCIATYIYSYDCSNPGAASVVYASSGCIGSATGWGSPSHSSGVWTWTGTFATSSFCDASGDCSDMGSPPSPPSTSSVDCSQCIETWIYSETCSGITLGSPSGPTFQSAACSSSASGWGSPSFSAGVWTWIGTFANGIYCVSGDSCSQNTPSISPPDTSSGTCNPCIATYMYTYDCLDNSISQTYQYSSCTGTATGWGTGTISGSVWTWLGTFATSSYCASSADSCTDQGDGPGLGNLPYTSPPNCSQCVETWVYVYDTSNGSLTGPTFQSSSCSGSASGWGTPSQSGTQWTWTGTFLGAWCLGGSSCTTNIANPSPPSYTSPAASPLSWHEAGTGVLNASSTPISTGQAVYQWQDQSGHGNTISVSTGSPTYIDSVLNGQPVIRFSGSDALTLGTTTSQAFTIFIVAVIRGNSDNSDYLYDGTSGSNRVVAAVNAVGGDPNSFGTYAGNVVSTTWDVLAQKSWHQYEAYYDSTSSILTIDGVPQAMGDTGTTNLSGLLIGSRYTATNYLVGDIAEILIYPATMSALDEITTQLYLKQKYTLPPTKYATQVLMDSPAIYLRMQETSGAIANDSSGDNRNGTYTGGITQGDTGGLTETSTSVLFDGSTGYIENIGSVSTFSFLQNNAVFSFECWCKFTDYTPAVWNTFFGNTDGGGGSGNGSQVTIDNRSGLQRLNVLLWNDAIGAPTLYAYLDGVFADDNWHYLAIVVNGTGSVTAWLDGVETPMTVSVTNALASGDSARNMQVASINPDVPGRFNGNLQELAIYTIPLTADRILAHYNTGRGIV